MHQPPAPTPAGSWGEEHRHCPPTTFSSVEEHFDQVLIRAGHLEGDEDVLIADREHATKIMLELQRLLA